jgi:hypothetical protein
LEKKESHGTDSQVVEFGCMRSIASGILDSYLCDICIKVPKLPKIFISIKLNIDQFLLLRLYFLFKFNFYRSFVMSACIYQSGCGNA